MDAPSNHSPVPKPTADLPGVSPAVQVKTMSFPEAVREIITGKKVTRLEWKDKTTYGELLEGFLRIHRSGVSYIWHVNDGDLINNDWVVVE